jgi:hypothetical protein
MKRKVLLVSVASALLSFGCPADDPPPETGVADDDDDGDTDTGGEQITTASNTAGMTSVGSTGEPETTTGAEPTTTMPVDTEGPGFLQEPDGGGVAVECDVWEDDCPDGEKCMPWANDGGNSWNATRCSPLDPDAGAVGDTCTVEGSGVSGLDTCTSRAMCYYVDQETNEGVCIGFCDGTPMAPTCDPGYICTIVNDGVLTLCRPECDPLLQNCDGDAACLQATGSDGFTCITDASGEAGAAGDPCEYINSCDPGLTCGEAAALPGCAGATGCCTEFCDLTEAEPSANCSLGGGVECVGWWEDGQAPPGYEHVGVCLIPV